MNKQKHLQKYGLVAYTLAEMLIVMGIMAIVLLSLPSFTKKLFKVEETRKPHGRFECYWDENTDKLMSYYAEEGGVISGPNESEVTDVDGNPVCEFNPPRNPVYFIVHAVGGGGAGASLDSANLEPKAPTSETAISNLHLSVPSNWPDWVRWLKRQFVAVVGKQPFDVSKTYTQQYLQYRIAGSPAELESLFLPQLDPGTKLQLAPGKGGVVSDSISTKILASGGDGKPSYVRFIKGSTNEIALLANGGKGGDGTVVGDTSFTLRGQAPGDLGLSAKSSVKAKLSEFMDVVERSSSTEIMKSQVPENVGGGGAGSTQTVSSTDGEMWYRWIKYKELIDSSRRIGREWENVTWEFWNYDHSKELDGGGVTAEFEKRQNGGLETCSMAQITPSSAAKYETRVGYCTKLQDITAVKTPTYFCTVGYTEDQSDQTCTGDGSSDCIAYKFQINSWGTTTPTLTSSGTNDYSDCEISDTSYLEMTCKKKVNPSSGSMDIIKCTTPTGATEICLSGVTPVKTSEGASTKMCPPSNGKNGAVIILW